MSDRTDDIDDDEDTVELSDGFLDELPDEEQDDQDDDSDDQDDDQDDDSDDSDDEDTDQDAGEDDSDNEGEAPAKAAAAKKRSAKDRIRELAEKRREAEKAAFELELRNIELEKRLKERAPGTTDLPKEPNPKDFKYGQVDDDYQAALVDYRVAVKLAEVRASTDSEARSATEAERNAAYRQKLELLMAEGKKRHRGFEDAINNTIFEPELARMVLDSDNGVDIAFHLSKNIGDLRTLTRASPTERARMLGRLEGKFSATSAAKKRTQAPETIGKNRRTPPRKPESKYGPEDQDAFDKAFLQLR